MRGALARIGDTVDAITGRRWVPSSSLATSELIERMKRLLDAEAKDCEGKGKVVPHNIKLKVQWDKFSTDSEDALTTLKNELLTAAADHINDSLYYTYAPLHVEVKPDYFTEGVKLYVGFDTFSDDEPEVEMNVTIAGVQFPQTEALPAEPKLMAKPTYIFRFDKRGKPVETQLAFEKERRVSVGRTPNNDVALDDISVSKIHASLMADAAGDLMVADTGSTNGTFINGQRIPYGKASAINEGDILMFGSVEVKFERQTLLEEPISAPSEPLGQATSGERETSLPERARETVRPVPDGEKTAELDELSSEERRAETVFVSTDPEEQN